MKVEHINPFVKSVIETFRSMLGCEVKHGKPSVTVDDGATNDLIGVIGLTGTAQGTIALKFPPQTAMAMVGKLVGMEFKSVDSSVIDGVGELVNIIAGNAKVKFEGHRISISLPTVLRGGIYKLTVPAASRLTVPFMSENGNFEILVSFRPTAVEKEEAVHESAYSG